MAVPMFVFVSPSFGHVHSGGGEQAIHDRLGGMPVGVAISDSYDRHFWVELVDERAAAGMGAGMVVGLVDIDVAHFGRGAELDIMIGVSEPTDLVLTIEVAADPLVKGTIS